MPTEMIKFKDSEVETLNGLRLPLKESSSGLLSIVAMLLLSVVETKVMEIR